MVILSGQFPDIYEEMGVKQVNSKSRFGIQAMKRSENRYTGFLKHFMSRDTETGGEESLCSGEVLWL